MKLSSVLGPADPVLTQIWDRPVCVVHWTFAVAVPALWWTAENNEMGWHFRIGILVLMALVFRILWGFFGGSTARFVGFVVAPARAIAYLRGEEMHSGLGHNPAGGYSVLALLTLLVMQVGLGVFAGDPDDGATGPLNSLVSVVTADRATQLHETVFYILLSFIALHLIAIGYHRLVRGEKLVEAMISGKRSLTSPAGPAFISAPRARVIACATVSILFGWWIWSGAVPLG